jgi:hypothetical protein
MQRSSATLANWSSSHELSRHLRWRWSARSSCGQGRSGTNISAGICSRSRQGPSLDNWLDAVKLGPPTGASALDPADMPALFAWRVVLGQNCPAGIEVRRG